jgi:hypothetical protein
MAGATAATPVNIFDQSLLDGLKTKEREEIQASDYLLMTIVPMCHESAIVVSYFHGPDNKMTVVFVATWPSECEYDKIKDRLYKVLSEVRSIAPAYKDCPIVIACESSACSLFASSLEGMISEFPEEVRGTVNIIAASPNGKAGVRKNRVNTHEMALMTKELLEKGNLSFSKQLRAFDDVLVQPEIMIAKLLKNMSLMERREMIRPHDGTTFTQIAIQLYC